MLVFVDEAWTKMPDGSRLGTLGALGLDPTTYNNLEDRIFRLKEKYFGFENARTREIKGKQLISNYEFRRQAGGTKSMKLLFAREVLEELRRIRAKTFGVVVHREDELDLLCEESTNIDRPYEFLMERVNGWIEEMDPPRVASITFDDRGLGRNQSVARAFGNFLHRSKTGRSFSGVISTAFFAYSNTSIGIQCADLVTRVISRFHTDDDAAPPALVAMNEIVKNIQWRSKEPGEEGFHQHGLKVIKKRETSS